MKQPVKTPFFARTFPRKLVKSLYHKTFRESIKRDLFPRRRTLERPQPLSRRDHIQISIFHFAPINEHPSTYPREKICSTLKRKIVRFSFVRRSATLNFRQLQVKTAVRGRTQARSKGDEVKRRYPDA